MPGLGGYGATVVLLGAWLLSFLLSGSRRWRLHEGISDAIYRILSGFPGAQQIVHRLFQSLWVFVGGTYALSLGIATLALPLAFVVRMVARARLRAGHPDPLDHVRSWVSRPSRAAVVLAAFPVACQVLMLHLSWGYGGDWSPLYFVVAGLASGLAQLALVRSAVRSMLAPTLAAREREATVAIDADEIRFNAVAVTRETRAAVGVLAAVSLAVIGWMVSLPTLALFKDPRVFTVIGIYVAVAAASALLFRGASRISVGLDGIYVGGTSRARFYAYRDIDQARLRGGDLELVRGERVVLRLQLHGEDATRRDAILDRIHQALARVQHVERDAAANFVTSRSTERVAQSIRGGGDYRMPSVSHDALWSLVEGSAVDASTRTAAAQALVRTGGDAERDRLRVAAAHCADPRVRVVLEELAADALDEQDGADLPPPRVGSPAPLPALPRRSG